MPFIDKKYRENEGYERVIGVLARFFAASVQDRDCSHLNYILSSSLMRAWKVLGWGYNNGADLKKVIHDVHEEFQRRRNEYEVLKQKENGDIVDTFEQLLTEGTPKMDIIEPENKGKVLGPDGEPIGGK